MTLERDFAEQIKVYRERFRVTPAGRWRTARGTFDAVSSDTVNFCPDHTGVIEYGSAFSGETSARFEWREKGERVIELRYVEDEVADEQEPWDEISYDFKRLETDAGGEVVLHEVGRDGFWDLPAPLRLIE